MQSEVGEEILYEMEELQSKVLIDIACSVCSSEILDICFRIKYPADISLVQTPYSVNKYCSNYATECMIGVYCTEQHINCQTWTLMADKGLFVEFQCMIKLCDHAKCVPTVYANGILKSTSL